MSAAVSVVEASGIGSPSPWMKRAGMARPGSPRSSVPAAKCSATDSIVVGSPSSGISSRSESGGRTLPWTYAYDGQSTIRIFAIRVGSSSPSAWRATSSSRDARSSGVRRATMLATSSRSTVRESPQRLDEDEPGHPLRVRDRDVHREVTAPRMADQPGAVPAELIEEGDLVGDMGLDVTRPFERRGIESALLRQDAIDESVELLDQPDDGLRPVPGTAVQEDRRRPAPRRVAKISPPGTATVNFS